MREDTNTPRSQQGKGDSARKTPEKEAFHVALDGRPLIPEAKPRSRCDPKNPTGCLDHIGVGSWASRGSDPLGATAEAPLCDATAAMPGRLLSLDIAQARSGTALQRTGHSGRRVTGQLWCHCLVWYRGSPARYIRMHGSHLVHTNMVTLALPRAVLFAATRKLHYQASKMEHENHIPLRDATGMPLRV